MQPRILMTALIVIAATVLPLIRAQEKKGPSFPTGEDDPRLLPGFFLGGYRFKVDPYIEMAVALQKPGKEKAIQALKDGKLGDKEFGGDGLFVLCRMLFVSKKDGEFRRPAIGAPQFLAGGFRGETSDWPLEPITLLDGVPFCIVQGYILNGIAERPSSYLQYCLENCEWSDHPFTPKSKAEKRAALDKLLESPRMKGLTGGKRNFLKAQIE